MGIYKRHRFSPDIISSAVGSTIALISVIEDFLAERGITVIYDTIRFWCIKFGDIYTRPLKRKHRG